MPKGIETYDSRSETIARKLARSSSATPAEQKHLGQAIIRESGDIAGRAVRTGKAAFSIKIGPIEVKKAPKMFGSFRRPKSA